MCSKAGTRGLVQKAMGRVNKFRKPRFSECIQELGQNTTHHDRTHSVNISYNYIIVFIIVLAALQQNKQAAGRPNT